MLGGVDTYKDDPLASFSMTAEGILRRDEYAVGQARRRGIPVLYVTSGGYSREAWRIQYRSIANLLEKFAGATRTPPDSSRGSRSTTKGGDGKRPSKLLK